MSTVTYQSILDGAIRILGENEATGDLSDYTDRAPYLLGAWLGLTAPIDARYRQANGLSPVSVAPAVRVELTDAFALSEIFLPSATLYLAAMLAIEESEALHERLFAMYADCIATVQKELPMLASATVDVYGLRH